MRGKLTYCPALDGLRAIAVLAVIAYHAGLPVPGGFVGVDIFFVISGYLITRLLHDELQRTGRISFLDFYARRARRILPAITVVVVVTFAASVALLSQTDVAATGKAAAASFLFLANIFFANATSGYFDPVPQDNPLLHLWSLGVEEQFYLVWPVVLLFARKRPVPVLAGIAVVSFAACEWLLWNGYAQQAFYQTPARAWELAAGGLIAFSRFRLPRSVIWVGLASIAAALILPYDHFPGTGALPAVLGASLLIAALHGGQGYAPLEARPVVWIGLMSYSLYLWHWPVMVLAPEFPMWTKVAATFILATLSYRFVETPFRKRWVFPARRSVVAAAFVVVTGASSAISIQQLQLGATPIPPADVPLIYKMGCDDWYASAEVKPCVFGAENAPHKAVIIGDSVALQWFPAVYKIFDRPDWKLIVLTKSACPMVDVSFYYDRIQRVYTECDNWRRDALAMVANLKPDVVLAGSSNSYDFTPAQWRDGTRRVLAQLGENAAEVRLLRSTPMLVPGGSNAFPDVAAWQHAAAAGLTNAMVIDMNHIVCPRNYCTRSSAAGPIFRDDRHIAWNYSATLAEALEHELQISSLK